MMSKKDRRMERSCEAALLMAGYELPEWHLTQKWARDYDEAQPGLGKLLHRIVEMIETSRARDEAQGRAREWLSARHDEYLGIVIVFQRRVVERMYRSERAYPLELIEHINENEEDTERIALDFFKRIFLACYSQSGASGKALEIDP